MSTPLSALAHDLSQRLRGGALACLVLASCQKGDVAADSASAPQAVMVGYGQTTIVLAWSSAVPDKVRDARLAASLPGRYRCRYGSQVVHFPDEPTQALVDSIAELAATERQADSTLTVFIARYDDGSIRAVPDQPRCWSP